MKTCPVCKNKFNGHICDNCGFDAELDYEPSSASTCPICSNEYDGVECSKCGYDSTTDYESYCTLKPINSKTLSIATMRKEWRLKDSKKFRCPNCGCSTFYLIPQETNSVCSSCGKTIGIAAAMPKLDNGEHKQINDDGSVTIGTKINGIWQGPFRKIMLDQSSYEGTYINGKTEGILIYSDSNGTVTKGEYHSGNWNGPFTMTFKSGVLYSGTKTDGKITGTLEYHDQYGNIQIGEWRDNAWNGPGKYICKTDGSVINAEWNNGKVSSGTIQYKNGDVYIGQIRDYVRNGKGTLTFKNGSHITAFFSNKNGKETATITFTNDAIYQGDLNDGITGSGTFTALKTPHFMKIIYKGRWKDGLLNDMNGVITITTNSNETYEFKGNIHLNEIVGEGILYYVNQNRTKDVISSGPWVNGRNQNKQSNKKYRIAEQYLQMALNYIKETTLSHLPQRDSVNTMHL